MKGKSDEDLYKVIPSLSLTRSVILLTSYFNEYIKSDYMVEGSSCGCGKNVYVEPSLIGHTSTLVFNMLLWLISTVTNSTYTGLKTCPCHKYSSKLDEILSSLCKEIDDDTSDDILSNVIQFVSYVVKDEFSEVKEFDYNKKSDIEGKTFETTKLGCCCCCTKNNADCCCNGTDGKCPCGESGECCTNDKCCCNTNNGCCCINGIDIKNGDVKIDLCDCCCKHVNGKCKCTCTPVSENKYYCCCLCDDKSTTCPCTTAASASADLKKCCCTKCKTSACCQNCECCSKEIKICNCCQCFKSDNLISYCDLTPSTNGACGGGKCCCCGKNCKCSEINGCNDLTGNGTCGTAGQYCCNESDAKCTLDICKITCCMNNLTKNGTSGSKVCLLTIVKDMKNFSRYLERIKGRKGDDNCTCTCEDNKCCCEKVDGKCCDMYCKVLNMYKEIFKNETSSGGKNGNKGQPVSICKDGDKCIFCILGCLEKRAKSIQSEYKNCAAECCDISTTCSNTEDTTCTTSGASTCPATTNGCATSTAKGTGTCQCSTISSGCPGANCCDCKDGSPCSICKISPSSIFSCIKKLYRFNDRFIKRLINVNITHLISHHNFTLLLINLITINRIYTLSALVKLHLKHLSMIDILALLNLNI